MHFKNPFFVVLIILLFVSNLNAQFYVGAYGGYSRSNYSGDTPPSELYGWGGGLIGGISTSYDLTNLVAVSINFNINENNAKYNLYEDDVKIDSATLKLLTLGIPIGVIVKGKNKKFYVKSAFEIQRPIYAVAKRVNSTNDFKDQIVDYGLAFQFGAGYIIPIGRPRLITELNYVQGISNIKNDLLEEDVAFKMKRTKVQGLRFKVGIEFPIGKIKEGDIE